MITDILFDFISAPFRLARNLIVALIATMGICAIVGLVVSVGVLVFANHVPMDVSQHWFQAICEALVWEFHDWKFAGIAFVVFYIPVLSRVCSE